MRFLATLLTCLLALPVSAEAWEALLKRRRQADPGRARWSLHVRPQDFQHPDALADPLLPRMLTSGDFGLEPLDAEAAAELWRARGWGREPHWVVLAPNGEELAAGAGRPKGEAILERIHHSGHQLRWERREAFLREHPNQGEAWLEAVAQALQVLRLRLRALQREGKVAVPAWNEDPATWVGYNSPRVTLPPGSGGADRADELYGEVAAALEQLLRVPRWTQEAGPLAPLLAGWDVGQSPRLRKLFAQAAEDLEAAFRRDPCDLDLAGLLVEALVAGRGEPGRAVAGVLPVPGQAWPEPAMLAQLLDPFYAQRDWARAQALLAELAPAAPEPPAPAAWETYVRARGAVLAHQAMCLAGQGSWDQAAATLGEARDWSGAQGVREALMGRGLVFTGPGGATPWRQVLAQVLAREGGPPPAPAAPPPLRLVVGGMPRWIVAWGDLRRAQDLAPWSPAELTWEVASPAEHRRRQARYGWGPGPRWALFRGDQLLAGGRDCPAPAALAGILAQQGLPQLQRLGAVLAAQPDHLAVRRERFRTLLRRMPNPWLEPMLAEDAALAQVPLEFGPDAPWRPDPDLWAQAARQVLPALTEAVRAWPGRSHLWQAWVSWARFDPARPSVLDLAESAAFWAPRGAGRAGLPLAVHRQVAREMDQRGDYSAMRDWFRKVWEAMDRRPLDRLHPAERKWLLERRREEQSAVVQPLRLALTRLGCHQELAELDRTFGEMMGVENPRRP